LSHHVDPDGQRRHHDGEHGQRGDVDGAAIEITPYTAQST
jgi:hypothetical protein